MSTLGFTFCTGYLITPVVEACRQAGLFGLLDRREFRDRAWLGKELDANAGYFTIALDALASLGWLEKDGEDAYRVTSEADRYPGRGLTSLYAVALEQLIAEPSHACTLREKIEQLFPASEDAGRPSADAGRGAVV